jgi:hypothetical protein
MKSCIALYNEAFPEDPQPVPNYFVRERQDGDWITSDLTDVGRNALQEWFAHCFVCPTEQLNGLRTDKSEFETVDDFIQFTTDRLAVDRTRYEFLAAAMVTVTNISRYTQELEATLAKLEKASRDALKRRSSPQMSAEQFQQLLEQQANQHREWCDMQERWHIAELKPDGQEKSS